MTDSTKKYRCKHFHLLLLLICVLTAVLFLSCASENTSIEEDSNYGSVAVSISIAGEPIQHSSESFLRHSMAIDGDSKVHIDVKDSSGNVLKSGGPWNWNAGSGTVTGVPAGENRKIVVRINDSTDSVLLYQGGTQSNVNIPNGGTRDLAGTPIVVYPPNTDYINASPTNWSTDVSIYTSIAITFSAAIDLDTVVYGESFVVYEGDDTGAIDNMVVGVLSLSDDGLTISFNPSNNLSLGTAYGVLVTTAVKDLSGNNLIQHPDYEGANYIGAFYTEETASTACEDFSGIWDITEYPNSMDSYCSEDPIGYEVTVSQDGCDVSFTILGISGNPLLGQVEEDTLYIDSTEFTSTDGFTTYKTTNTNWELYINGDLTGYSSWTYEEDGIELCTGESTYTGYRQ